MIYEHQQHEHFHLFRIAPLELVEDVRALPTWEEWEDPDIDGRGTYGIVHGRNRFDGCACKVWMFYDKRYWTERGARVDAESMGQQTNPSNGRALGFLRKRQEIEHAVATGEMTAEEGEQAIRELEHKAMNDYEKRQLRFGAGENGDRAEVFGNSE